MKSELEKDVRFWFSDSDVVKKTLQKAVKLEAGLRQFLEQYNRIAAEDCPAAQVPDFCYHLALYLIVQDECVKPTLMTFLMALQRVAVANVNEIKNFLNLKNEIFSSELTLKNEHSIRVNAIPKRFRGEYPLRDQKILLYDGRAEWDSGVTVKCVPTTLVTCKGDKKWNTEIPLYNCQEKILTVDTNFGGFFYGICKNGHRNSYYTNCAFWKSWKPA